MIEEAQKAVREFHKEAGFFIGSEPTMAKGEELSRTVRWIQEELEEFEVAITLVDQLDALADLLYFVIGTFVRMGVNGDKIFQIVHDANMRKLTMTDEREYFLDGKLKKPENWISPEGSIYEYLETLGIFDGDR